MKKILLMAIASAILFTGCFSAKTITFQECKSPKNIEGKTFCKVLK